MSVLKETKAHLATAVNDKSRRITLRGSQAIVPLKFGLDGRPAAAKTLILKRLTLDDFRFLKAWRESDWSVEAAVQKTGVPQDKVERLIKKLQCFRDEDAKVRALCEIPNSEWLTAKHVENAYDGGALNDSQHKSYVELAKITGSYKQTAQTQINVFNLPKLTPEAEAKFKALADQIVDSEQVA